jgi:hypothetical protein
VENFGGLAAFPRQEQSRESACDEKRDGGDNHQDLSEGECGARKPCKRETHYYFRQRTGFRSYEKNGQIVRDVFFNLSESELREAIGGS